MGVLAKEYPPLLQEYKKARRIIQQDGERKRSSAVAVSSSVKESENGLIELTSEILKSPDSVESTKKFYVTDDEFKLLFEQLEYLSVDEKVLLGVNSEAEARNQETANSQTYHYKLIELVDEFCIDTDDGQKVYDLIHPHLLAECPVELDFSEVKIAAPPFLSFAIGQLLKDISLEKLNHLLKITNLDSVGKETLEIIFEDHSQYYSDSQFRSIVDRVIGELVDAF